LLVGADGGEDRRAAPHCELNGAAADRARPASHEDRLALHRAVCEDAAVGSHGRNAEAGRGVEVHIVRQGNGPSSGHSAILGGGAAGAVPGRFVYPDALPDAVGRDTSTHRVNDARAILVRNNPGQGHRALSSGPPIRIRGVHTRRMNPPSNLAPSGLRSLALTNLENFVGRPVPFVPCCAHHASHDCPWYIVATVL